MRHLLPALLTLCAGSAAAEPLATALLDAERNLGAHARVDALRSAEPDTVERLDAQLKLLELHIADSRLPTAQRQKVESVLRLLQAVRNEPRTLDGQPELPHLTVAVGEAGRSCAQAIPLDQGDTRRVPIAAGEALWFRVRLPDAVNLGLSTRGSGVDAALTVHTDCRTVDQPAVAHADDNFGLQADLVVPAARQSYWMVRYENLSPVGGDAVLRATTSGILQGTVRTREDVPLNDVRKIVLLRQTPDGWVFVTDVPANGGIFQIPVTTAGTYAARTQRNSFISSPWLDQAFKDVPCARTETLLSSCNSNPITTLEMDGLENRSIEFKLDRGASLSGTIRDPQGQPIEGARITLAQQSFNNLNAFSDALGRYRFEGLFPSPAQLRAEAIQHRTIMHANIPCGPGCGFPAGATPVPLALQSTSIVDFTLPGSPTLSVHVTVRNDQLANLPSPVMVNVLRLDGSIAATLNSSASAPVINFNNLPAGDYYLRATSGATVPQLYPEIECASDCIAELPQALRVTLPDARVTVPINLRIRRYPMLFGQLRDAVTNTPITGFTAPITVRVELLGHGQSIPLTAEPNALGNYRFSGIPPGSYRMRATATEHQALVHDGFPCQSPSFTNCTQFTPISITRNDPDRQIDFILTPLGRVDVRVISAFAVNEAMEVGFMTPSGESLRSHSVYPQSPNSVFPISAAPLGQTVAGLLSSTSVMLPQLYNGVDCPMVNTGFSSCSFAAATILNIQPGIIQDLTFTPRRVNSRRVIVRDAASGTPLANVAIDVWNLNRVRVASARTDANGIAWVNVAPALVHKSSRG